MIAQIGIGLFGVLAIALSQCERLEARRWACIAGLCSQPFWFATTALHDQWGIRVLAEGSRAMSQDDHIARGAAAVRENARLRDGLQRIADMDPNNRRADGNG